MTKISYSIKKIAVIGDYGVGKTSLIHALCNKEFLSEPESTVGAAYTQLAITRKDLVVMNQLNYESTYEMYKQFEKSEEINRYIQIWDTAGDERFRAIIPIYIRNVSLVLICYEANNENAVHLVNIWKEVCYENGISEKNIILVATKEDLLDRKKGGIYFMPDVMTSAKTGSGIQMLRSLLIYRSIKDIDLGYSSGISLEENNLAKNKKKCFC